MILHNLLANSSFSLLVCNVGTATAPQVALAELIHVKSAPQVPISIPPSSLLALWTNPVAAWAPCGEREQHLLFLAWELLGVRG